MRTDTRPAKALKLSGLWIRNLSKAEAASARWGGAAFESVEELFETQAIDVVSICLPDDLHYATLLALAEKPIKFIFLEKPAVTTTSRGRCRSHSLQ